MSTTTTKLPKKAHEYVEAIGETNATAMQSVAHKGVVRGGRRGHAKEPNFQVECPDGTVILYRAVDGEAKRERIGVPFDEQNLSDPLNDALFAVTTA